MPLFATHARVCLHYSRVQCVNACIVGLLFCMVSCAECGVVQNLGVISFYICTQREACRAALIFDSFHLFVLWIVRKLHLCTARPCVPGPLVICLMLVEVPPLTAAHRPRSVVWIGLLVLVVMSVCLSLVGVGKMHVHILWKTNQLDKVTELKSAALSQPLIQPTLQRAYTQETVLRSSVSRADARPNRGVRMCLRACVLVCLCMCLYLCLCPRLCLYLCL